MTKLRSFLIAALIGGAAWSARADDRPARKAPADLPEIKKLPDPFTFQDGSKVRTRADWPRRRAELQRNPELGIPWEEAKERLRRPHE